MKINKLSIAVILVNWKKYNLTSKCIDSLNKSNYKNFKIILVDNEYSEKSLIDLRNKHKELIVFKEKNNLGFAGGNNIGIRYALENDYDYIMLLNNDTEVKENFILPLVERIEKDHSLGAVQPLILNFSNKSIIWNAGGKLNKFLGLTSTRLNNNKLNSSIVFDDYTDWISGCCILIKSEILTKVGLLDEKFFNYYEDVDWSLRMKNLGYDLGFVKESIIYHHGSSSSKNKKTKEGVISSKIHYFNIRNHILLLKKHKNLFNFFGIVFFQIIKTTSYIFYFLIKFRFNKLTMVLKGLKHGLNNK
ncbi:MAG: glycosyltransferase family 2 protein [Flavobacteriaceae bacterium]|nr:glycosyltransferase family 2 protein [Flavobacteriaceae bacterium]MBT7320100.1 glycosyltransferase family 2 protein [Flavobacteriaceae bacterium]